jgi:hypothetical protein
MAKLASIGLAVACLLTALAPAQEKQENKSNDAIARYIFVSGYQLAGGKYASYTNLLAQFRDITSSAAPDLHWIAGTPITGDSDRVTYVSSLDSMASVEKMMTDFDKVDQAIAAKNPSLASEFAEIEKGSHSILAEYNKELSYRPDAVPMADTKWWSGGVYQLKPGCDYEFADALKQLIEVGKRTNAVGHWIAYNVRVGAPEPTILMVSPMQSLAERDQETPAAAREAFASVAMRQMRERIGKECIQHVEHSLTRVDPALSRPPQSLVAANPDFWTPKPAAPVASAKPAKGIKKVTAEPAR